MKEEIKYVELTEEEKVRLREVQQEILDVVVEICEKNNLEYFLIGGTCLGAVRHKGFIPWDDDIDIGMPRKSYDKFSEIAKEELGEKYFYQSFATDKDYPYAFAKVRKNNTLFVQKLLADRDMHHGIFIDIFPLDAAPKAEKGIKHVKKVVINNYIAIAPALNYSNSNMIHRLKVLVLSILRMLKGGHKTLFSLEDLLRKYSIKDMEDMGNLVGSARYKEIMEKTIFFDGDKINTATFEGKEYRVPLELDRYLTNIYGDYMALPPEDKRCSHHGVIDIKF